MDSQVDTRKLHFIEELLKVDNEDIIKKLAIILREERLKILEKESNEPLHPDALNAMIDRAEEDLRSGNYTSSSDLKSKVKKWK